jgi:hypothetical protein
MVPSLPEFKKITKIRTVLVQNSFSLRFAAVVIGSGIIKRAVHTAVQISPAGRALRLTAGKNIIFDCLFTLVTESHGNKSYP